MTLADLEETFKAAKKLYFADKSVKANKKAFKKAKKAFNEAKEAEPETSPKKNKKKKRSAEEAASPSAKKKAKKGPSLDELKTAAAAAKKEWKADKGNKDLKKVWKAAKKAFEEAGATAQEPEKQDVDSLKAALKAAKKLWKDDKSNKENKKAFKAAKKALADAEEASGDGDKAEEPVAKAAEVKAPEPVAAAPDFMAGLKSKGNYKKTEAKGSEFGGPPGLKVFLGNLSFDVDDDGIKKYFEDCGKLTDIFWLTDKETEKFRGMGFVTFESMEASAKACEKNGENFMGRDIRINYAKPRPNGGGRGGRPPKPLGEKPAGCTTVFLGNLSYDVDDDKTRDFFKECGTIADIRWLKDRESGEFRGAGFVQFEDPETAIDLAVKLNGTDFMGRNIRVDYAAPRKPREY